MKALQGKISIALLIAIIAGAPLPTLKGHAHAGEALVPTAWRTENKGPYTIEVTLAMDEEWSATFGHASERHVRQVLRIAAANVRPAGINLRLSRVARWRSDDDVRTIRPLLDVVDDEIPPDGSTITVAVTAGSYESAVDGLARAGHPYVLVRHHSGNLERDAYVLTHEIGHAFGLDHHVCEDALCFMADHGYDPEKHWCADHLDLLRVNAGYFEYMADAG